MFYRVLFSLVVYLGCTQTLNLVWSFSDIANALMAIPTEIKTILMIALCIWAVTALSKGAIKMLKYIALAVVIYACCTYFGIL